MSKKDRSQLLNSFRHRSVYTLDKNTLRLNCGGIDDGDKLLIIRILLSALIFLIAVVLELPTWAAVCLLEAAAIAAGFDIIITAVLSAAARNLFEPCIIITAVGVISLAVGQFREEAAVFLIYQICSLFLRVAASQVRDTMADGCMVAAPETAVLIRGDVETEIPVGSLKADDLIAVDPGHMVPVDCVVTEAGGAVDVSVISGSAEPVTVRESDVVYSGSIAVGSRLLCHVIKPADRSVLQNMNVSALMCADSTDIDDRSVIRLARIYQAAFVLLAVLVAVLLPVFTEVGAAEGIRRGVSVLALALPGAYVIPVPLIYLSGGLAERRNGVIFKSTRAIERTSRADTVIFDKQGTLTADERRVVSVKSDKMDAQMMLKIAAHAEAYSSHPIAKSIINAYGGVIYIELVQKFHEFAGEGIAVMVQDIPIVIGRQQFLERLGISVRVDGGVEKAVFMAIDGVYAGRIIFGSPTREKAASAVHVLTECGVGRIVLTTEESAESARSFGESLGIQEIYSETGAAEAAAIVKKLESGKDPARTILFAASSDEQYAAIDAADVGAVIAGGSTSKVLNTADVVVCGGPEKLANAVSSVKKTRASVRCSMLIAAVFSLILLVLCLFGIASSWFALIIEMAAAAVLVLFSGRLMFFISKKK